MNEIQDINRIETEINMLKHQTAQNIIEIGKRLIEAKAMLPHGEWGKWLEEKAQFSHRTANNFMKVSLEFEDSQALANLGQSKVFALLDLPQDQRDDFIQENPIDEMTTRELQQAIKDKKDLERQLDEERRKPPQVETIIVEKEPHDYNKLKHQVQDKQLELERLQKEKQILEAKAELNKKNADRYKELKEQIETLTQQKSDIGRRLNSATELSGMVVEAREFFNKKLAPIKYSRAIQEATQDETMRKNLTEILIIVQGWINEVGQYVKPDRNQIIDVEVIE